MGEGQAQPERDRWWLAEFLSHVEDLSRDPGYGTVWVEIRQGSVEYLRWSASRQREKRLDNPLL